MAVNYRAWTMQQKVSRVCLYIFMIVIVIFMVFPLYYMLITALKPLDELVKFPPDFFVRRPTLQNFSDLMTALDGSSVPFVRYIFNSVVTVVINVVSTLVICTMGSYGLVKHKVPFANLIFNMIVIAMMFSAHVTQIPSYIVITGIGLTDSYFALILPKLASAYSFFLMKQFLEQMPDAFLEAARIDGASEFTIFRKIVLPFLKPACATLVVFSFIGNWNDSSSPLIYITDQALKTLPIALQSINEGGSIIRAGAAGAASVVAILPTIIVFMTMQKKVIETMVYSGIK